MGRYASGGIEVYFVPEGHVKIMGRPQFLAEKLIVDLDGRAQPK